MKPTTKKVAFVAFSDIQIEDWKRYSTDHSRLYVTGHLLDRVRQLCNKYKAPALFGGDLFDNPKFLSNLVLQESLGWLSKFKEDHIQIFGIHGNHDQSEANYVDQVSPNYFQTLAKVFPNLVNVSLKTYLHHGEYIISGIPYLTGNVGFKTTLEKVSDKVAPMVGKKILLIHSDLPGAVDTSGREVGTAYDIPVHLNKFFKAFDLVLCGHIHKPQILRKKIVIMGATHQQRTSDSGVKMGCWLIYNDLTYKFIPLKAPEFIHLKPGEEAPEGGKDIYIPSPKIISTPENIKVKPFTTVDPKKLTKAFLKVKGIKSKSKSRLLLKYLSQ